VSLDGGTRAGERERQKWERAVREHRAALSAFLQAVQRIEAREWERSAGEGKWTAAEIVEHLSLAYEAALRELREGKVMQPRVSAAWQAVLRWFLLPHMLFHRSMPRSRAPREIRPASAASDPSEAVERMRRLGEETEEALEAVTRRPLTHPYFGPLDRVRVIRLMALHIEHHQRQLPPARAGTP
jgi:hypothetical protein